MEQEQTGWDLLEMAKRPYPTMVSVPKPEEGSPMARNRYIQYQQLELGDEISLAGISSA